MQTDAVLRDEVNAVKNYISDLLPAVDVIKVAGVRSRAANLSDP